MPLTIHNQKTKAAIDERCHGHLKREITKHFACVTLAESVYHRYALRNPRDYNIVINRTMAVITPRG